MFDFDQNLSRLSGVTVLCVGDLMLDDFVYGEVARISPEAPAPVIAVKRSEMVIGGAGNVARNVASLGAQCVFVGLVGEDDAGRTLKAALAAEPRITASLVVDTVCVTSRPSRLTTSAISPRGTPDSVNRPEPSVSARARQVPPVCDASTTAPATGRSSPSRTSPVIVVDAATTVLVTWSARGGEVTATRVGEDTPSGTAA